MPVVILDKLHNARERCIMKTPEKLDSSVVNALVAVLKDSKNLVVSSCELLKLTLESLPKHLLISLILLTLAVLERLIAKGDFDRWIA